MEDEDGPKSWKAIEKLNCEVLTSNDSNDPSYTKFELP